MELEQIVEGRCYMNSRRPNYFRQVELIVESDSRGGGKLVAWSTDGFLVQTNSRRGGQTHGKCSIETFAKWATTVVE